MKIHLGLGFIGYQLNSRTALELYRLLPCNIAPENQHLEDEIPFGARPIFRGELLVSGAMQIHV